MTVIAWDGKMIAGDSLGCLYDRRVSPGSIKVRKIHDGFAAVSGKAGAAERFFKWCEDGQPEPFPALDGDSGYLYIDGENVCRSYDQYGFAGTISAPFAFGAAGDLAMGAMAVGANAYDAVRIAIKYNTSCGGPITFFYTDLEKIDKDAPFDCSTTLSRAITGTLPGYSWQYLPTPVKEDRYNG